MHHSLPLTVPGRGGSFTNATCQTARGKEKNTGAHALLLIRRNKRAKKRVHLKGPL